MRKSFWVTSLICAFICCSLAFAPSADAPLYKNLKILPKSITKPELDSVMRSFTRALGVKCDFCHAKREDGGQGLDFASDKEEAKGEARGMMKMTAKINKKFFKIRNASGLHTKLEVTCYTCHHGQGHPARTAPAGGGPGSPGGNGPGGPGGNNPGSNGPGGPGGNNPGGNGPGGPGGNNPGGNLPANPGGQQMPQPARPVGT